MEQFPRRPARWAGLTPVSALVLACAGGPAGEAGVQVLTAPLSSGGCTGAGALSGLPDEVDRLFVSVVGSDARPLFEQQLVRGEDDLGVREVLIERIPVTEGARMLMHACTGTALGWYGASPAFDVGENRKIPVTVVLRPVDQLSCAGTGQGQDFNDFAQLGRPRAFAAVASLPDGRLFIGGGASQISADGGGGLLSAVPADQDYDAYDPVTALFPPALDRTREDPGPRLRLARIGAQAFTLGTPEAPKLLLVGGADQVAWSVGSLGPLGLVAPVLPEPFLEVLDATSETSVPVRATVQPGVVPRFLPASAQDPASGLVVLAGGIEYVEGRPAPSARLDLIEGTSLRSFPLDRPRVGASITPLGGNRFLLWGGDVDDCGAAPALLIDANQAAPLRPLPLEAEQAAPTCQARGGDRAWWATAWHAATSLGQDFDGTQRVLITGGVEILEGAVEQTPDIGGAGRAPNVFRLLLSPSQDSLRLERLAVPADVAPHLKRALHDVVRMHDRLVVSGGWAALEGGFVGLNPLSELVFAELDLAAGAPKTWRMTPSLALSEPRLGHVTVPTADGGLLFAGGVRRDVLGTFSVSRSAEIYRPAPVFNPCGQSGVPSPLDGGISSEFGLLELGLADATLATD